MQCHRREDRIPAIAVLLAAFVVGFAATWTASDRASAADPTEPFVHGDWPFRPAVRPELPAVEHPEWVAQPIDAFVLAELEAEGLRPSGRAERLTLLRRLTFDLTGLLPTQEEQEAFLAEDFETAYPAAVERLLASPHYGERWAQHWLDLVRYAETIGFKSDITRPYAYKYRDYVIDSFNRDRPYDEFVRQQLAGDELDPDNPDALIATGLNRLYPDEDNAANLMQRRQEILDDVTDVTGLAFMGLTMGCAQCHDHKFDDILQTDYYRLQAFFAPMVERDDLTAATRGERKRYAEQLATWEQSTAAIRAEMDELLARAEKNARAYRLEKFREEIQQCYLTPAEERTPHQEQISRMVERQLDVAAERGAMISKLPDAEKKHYRELERQMAKFDELRPAPLPGVMAVSDVGHNAPPTYLLATGNVFNPQEQVQPGFPLFLSEAEPSLPEELDEGQSTGRRSALAAWMTDPNHPLTARVIVNRLWQHHFGRGIVATPNDFGMQGDPPTHPDLLDWLAVELVESGWSLKHMHRLMVTSATYCQSSLVDPQNPSHAAALAEDGENDLLWHTRRRRLEGEAIRDCMLQASGRLNARMFGKSALPKLPDGVSDRYAWKPNEREEDRNRRSIYVFAKRNLRYPIFETFDQPDMHGSCAARATTTAAPQALSMLNGDLSLELARHWAEDLVARFGSDVDAIVREAYTVAMAERATDDDLAMARQFIEMQSRVIAPDDDPKRSLDVATRPVSLNAEAVSVDEAFIGAVADFCHALFNSNAFLYVD